MSKKLLLGSDGLFHMHTHNCACQQVSVPVPLSRVLSMRCVECGTASEYEHSWNAYKESAQPRVQRIGLIARIGQWFGATPNR
jgi:hypothetical protein